jgi:hypothetical protein
MGFGEFIEGDLGNMLCNLHRESEKFQRAGGFRRGAGRRSNHSCGRVGQAKMAIHFWAADILDTKSRESDGSGGNVGTGKIKKI